MLPAFGGKLKIVSATLRLARSLWRSATSFSIRPASTSTLSGCALMQERPLGQVPRLRAQTHGWVPVAFSVRPPNTIVPVAPSSSGIATMMVVSIGIRPRSESSQRSIDWNSVTCAAT